MLLSIDTLISINNPDRVEDIISTVCQIGCSSNKGYTGQFSLEYSLKNQSFTDFSGDQYTLDLPFIGYKCPNSLLDYFYTEKKIELESFDDDLPTIVRDHIAETRSNNTYPSIFDLLIKKDTSIEGLSDIIAQVLQGISKFTKNMRH